jgi:rhodanese-related sulfurtransferase
LGSFPPYFHRLAEVNRRGPAVLAAPPALTPLDAARTRALLAGGAVLVDARPVKEFAAAHVPGSLSIPLRPAFASWLGWLVPPDRPLVVLRGDGQDAAEIAWQAAKIGFDLAGELSGGLASWTDAGQPVTRTRLVNAGEVAGAVVDIRQAAEFAGGHLPGAHHVELGALADRLGEVPREPLVVMCGHGERAMGAASLLERAGHRDVSVLVGGPTEWAAATGRNLETGT